MLRARWAWVTGIGGVVGAGAFVASCTAAQEAIGISSAPLTVGSVYSTPPTMDEPSGDWSPDGAVLIDGSILQSDILVTGFNYWLGNQFGWAWSDNRGATWTVCSSDQVGPDGGVTNCNAPFGSFDQGKGWKWYGDPTIVTDRRGRAVYVTMADPENEASACSKGRMNVVAVVSHDGGKTFDPNTFANLNDNGCSNGCQDQPDATFDFTTSPPTFWVAFRHAGVPGGAHGVCARRFFLDSTDHLQPLDQAYDVNTVSGRFSEGAGAVRIRAGGGVTTIVYGDTENLGTCPDTNLYSVGVASVSSTDGAIWSNNNVIMDTNSTFPDCTLSQQVDMQHGPRNYDFVRAVDGTNYVIFQDTKSTLRLFMDRVFGVQPSGRGESEWREWCAGSATADAGALTPMTNWAPRGTTCSTPFYTQGQAGSGKGSGNSLAWPTIAADDQGRLAVAVYEADSTDTMFHVHYRQNVAPRDPSSSWADADLTTDFMPGNEGGVGRVLGDYEAMLVRNALRQPTCGGTGTFFPTYITLDAGAVDADDRSRWVTTVEVTP